MPISVKTMAKRGNKRMRKNRSRAASVAWPLMGGPKRKKDLDVSTVEYFAMGVSLAGDLARRMREAKLPPEDGQVFLVLSDSPDFKQPGAYCPVTSGHENDWAGVIAAAQQIERHIAQTAQTGEPWWRNPPKVSEKDAGAVVAASVFAAHFTFVGLVVCIWDREKSQCIAFSRPFIVSKLAAVQLLESAMLSIRQNVESKAIS
jgi:hypothetical protein